MFFEIFGHSALGEDVAHAPPGCPLLLQAYGHTQSTRGVPGYVDSNGGHTRRSRAPVACPALVHLAMLRLEGYVTNRCACAFH